MRKEQALRIYQKMMQAAEAGLLASAHDLSDGGLAVALAESAFGGNLGANVRLPEVDLSLHALMFAESHSRFVVSVRPQHRQEFEALFGEDAYFLGEVSNNGKLEISDGKQTLLSLAVEQMLTAWRSGLVF